MAKSEEKRPVKRRRTAKLAKQATQQKEQTDLEMMRAVAAEKFPEFVERAPTIRGILFERRTDHCELHLYVSDRKVMVEKVVYIQYYISIVKAQKLVESLKQID